MEPQLLVAAPLEVGTECEVFSSAAGAWVLATVLAAEGDDLRVRYRLGNGSVREKWVSQSSAEQVRPVDEPIPTVAPQPGSPVPPDSPTPSLALTLAKTPAVGAECQVYSSSASRWVVATVVEVDGGSVRARYTLRGSTREKWVGIEQVIAPRSPVPEGPPPEPEYEFGGFEANEPEPEPEPEAPAGEPPPQTLPMTPGLAQSFVAEARSESNTQGMQEATRQDRGPKCGDLPPPVDANQPCPVPKLARGAASPLPRPGSVARGATATRVQVQAAPSLEPGDSSIRTVRSLVVSRPLHSVACDISSTRARAGLADCWHRV